MKKISTYLIVAVASGAILTGVWIYEKYIKAPATSNLIFTAERRDIRETVKARGEVVSQKDFDLQFPVAGTVFAVYVKEGDVVPAGAPLGKLDTTQLELDLDKLLSHPAAKDVAVAQASLANAQASVNSANQTLLGVLNDSYLRADDIVRGKTDPMFTNPRTNAQFSYQVGSNESVAKNNVEMERPLIEVVLTKFKTELDAANAGSLGDLSAVDALARDAFSQINTYLQNLAIIVNNTGAVASYKDVVSAARTSISVAVTNLTTAEGNLSSAETNLDLAQKTLDLKNAAVGSENADIDIVKNKIAKSTLYAPIASRVTKIYLEQQESAQPGVNAISLSAVGYKIQSDISELDIGKVTAGGAGNDVVISLDAFQGKTFKGKVVFIEPQPVLKDTDKYYRANIFFEYGAVDDGVQVRSGMSSDLLILAELHKNAVVIPEIALYKSGGESFVDVSVNGKPVKTKVTTGISDGQNIEILSGLSGGETLVISG